MKSPGAQYVGKNLTYGFDVTADGFESHIGVNHIGHFYLTKLLTKKLKESAPSRVIAVSSGAEEGSYPGGIRPDLWRPENGIMNDDYEDGMAYGQSKLANLLFAREFASRMEGTGVSAYSCHPGIVVSELSRYMEDRFERDVSEMGMAEKVGVRAINAAIGTLFGMAQFSTADGALTQLQLETAHASDLKNGGFYHPIGRVVESSHPDGNDAQLQKTLWEETEMAIKKAL
uniref:Oxidoreductase n=1 Tax=Odontella aurita TaxID=265563 RepID=A0A7S4HIJ7_9STRA|mmetsp:Transcript_10573/g.31167  ORF Transcript_10573/g.31167 Transcript_10573/m.31167 type:complete len:230 (+) Transcript_10573:473-1162(+)